MRKVDKKTIKARSKAACYRAILKSKERFGTLTDAQKEDLKKIRAEHKEAKAARKLRQQAERDRRREEFIAKLKQSKNLRTGSKDLANYAVSTKTGEYKKEGRFFHVTYKGA